MDQAIAVVSTESAASIGGSILALDLGTTTGWALMSSAGEVTSGTMSFQPGRYEGGGMRFLRFGKWLAELCELSADLEAIYFEEVRRHSSTDAAHVYGGFLAALTARCEEWGLPYQGVPVGTIKRHATGKGNAAKDAVISAMRERGFVWVDDNEADALALLFWADDTQGGLAA